MGLIFVIDGTNWYEYWKVIFDSDCSSGIDNEDQYSNIGYTFK